MEQIVQNQMQEVIKQVEQHVDAEIEKLEKFDPDDFEKLREKRLENMKKEAKLRQEYLALGHGQYNEVPEEKEFFELTKKSKNVVCHFYKDGSARCKIADHHLRTLAPKHLETLFCKLNVEKCPFLTDRLKIKIIPTIVLFVDQKTKDYIVGFTDLGNRDDFTTEIMEWRIAQCGVINYSGDLMTPPDQTERKSKSLLGQTKCIRDKEDDESDGLDSD
ncbi:thioredoxin domain-containing protein 9 [Neocloeon triangulifer]|uniref:thioredoxin domain-containing protein 9 n=1 Tax=Neocloeon triangulifer TaxID=2078957 RepID=UPI00286F757A|nr:thioredoxin domain-containing protein 9 [Neocloeon triangulifer]